MTDGVVAGGEQVVGEQAGQVERHRRLGELDLTPGYTAPHREIAWRWACGDNRLPVPLSSGPSTMVDALRFMARSRPHEVVSYATAEAEFREHAKRLAPIAKAVRAAEDAGVPFRTILDYLRLTDAVATAK